jgi:hypothetical protein
MSPNKLQPAVLGGLFIGVLSALPIISAGNLCCCMWVIGGGTLASYLMQQRFPYAITIADGAVAGLLAGIIGGALTVFLQIPLEMMTAPFQQRLLERFLESAGGEMPFDTQEFLERWGSPANPIVIAFRLVLGVMIGMVFGLIGGIIGAAVFKKGGPPPGTAEVLPPQ